MLRRRTFTLGLLLYTVSVQFSDLYKFEENEGIFPHIRETIQNMFCLDINCKPTLNAKFMRLIRRILRKLALDFRWK